jgi:hypothetical protein
VKIRFLNCHDYLRVQRGEKIPISCYISSNITERETWKNTTLHNKVRIENCFVFFIIYFFFFCSIIIVKWKTWKMSTW